MKKKVKKQNIDKLHLLYKRKMNVNLSFNKFKFNI